MFEKSFNSDSFHTRFVLPQSVYNIFVMNYNMTLKKKNDKKK